MELNSEYSSGWNCLESGLPLIFYFISLAAIFKKWQMFYMLILCFGIFHSIV